MKKQTMTAILMAGLMAMTMAGCSAKKPATSKEFQVGVVQITEHTSLNQIRDSFLEEMERLDYGEEQVDFQIYNAQNEPSNLGTICQKLVGEKADLIVAIATPTAQTAKAATEDIPVLFSAVTDPVAAGLVKDPAAPEGNVTGTSDAIPVDQTLELCRALTPEVQTIGFLYTSGEPNSQVTVEKGIKAAKAMGFDYEVMTIAESSELRQAAESLAGKADAIYVPIDNTIAESMAVLAKVGTDRKIPVYVGADSMVMDGGLACVGIEYDDLGAKTAEMAVRLLEGTPVSQIPVTTMEDFDLIINRATAEALGIQIPEELAQQARIME